MIWVLRIGDTDLQVKGLFNRKEEKMIHVIAIVELKPGCREAYLEVLLGNVAAVKAEKGCLVYEPTIDVETDIPIHEKYGDNFVTIVEAWDDIAALKNHFNEPHMLAYREKAKDLIKKVTIRVLQPA